MLIKKIEIIIMKKTENIIVTHKVTEDEQHDQC